MKNRKEEEKISLKSGSPEYKYVRSPGGPDYSEVIPDKGDYTNWRQNRLPAIRIKDHNDLPNFILMRNPGKKVSKRERK